MIAAAGIPTWALVLLLVDTIVLALLVLGLIPSRRP